jgi:hypothetical protein
MDPDQLDGAISQVRMGSMDTVSSESVEDSSLKGTDDVSGNAAGDRL